MRTSFTRDIEAIARNQQLDPDVLEALVINESGGNPWAWNPEPRYHYLWDVKLHQPFRQLQPSESASETPPSDFWSLAGDRDQEWWGQQASWGLMQIMGAVARERGFRGPYLTELLSPQLNLEYSTDFLASLIKRATGNYQIGLAAYNAGWGGRLSVVGMGYASRVLGIVQQLGPRP